MKSSEHARALSKLGASKGGFARAKAMTPEERQEQARKAGIKGALVRWGSRRKREVSK